MPYPGEKIRPEDPDYWTWRYAFWSMRRHPGMTLLMFIWASAVGAVLGSVVSLPLLLLRGWMGKEAIRAAANVLVLLGVAYGIFFGIGMCREPFWWVTRRGGSRFD